MSKTEKAVMVFMMALALIAVITTIWVLGILMTPAIGDGTVIKEHVPVGRYYNGITLAKK